MLIDYRRELSPEERKKFDQIKEVLKAIEPKVEEFMAEHRRNSRRWSPHEVVPWGEGVDYKKVPWKPEQCPLSPDVVLALETNLLTEDNLPYYHAQIQEMIERGGVWEKWLHLWTAEEGVHSDTIRDYFYLMRVMDPVIIEKHRLGIMEAGFDRAFADPLEIFAYTSAQELATRISHLRTAQRADEPILYELLKLVSRDENFHYIFYRSVVKAVLEIAPELMLPALNAQLYSFEMPGTGMNKYELRRATIENAGIYGIREHRDLVIRPLLKFLEIDKLKDLPPGTAKVQSRVLKLDKVLIRMIEKQEKTPKKSEL